MANTASSIESVRARFRYILMGLIALLVFAASASTNRGSWPQFRGADRDGHVGPETEINLSGSNPPRLLWRTLIGQGFSGFVITNDCAYTLCQNSVGQYAVCLDMNSGKVIWQTRLGFPAHLNDDYPGPYSTPAVDNGRIFFADCSGKVGCLDARQGNLLWALNLVRSVAGEGADFGYASSPAVENGRVFLPAGGAGASIVALAGASGVYLWKNGSDRTSYSSCYLITVAGHRQVVAFLEQAVVARDPESGAELWRDDWGTHGYVQHCAAPIYHEPYFMYSSAFRQGARVLKLGYEGAKSTVSRVWESAVMCNDILSPVQDDGYVYGFDVQSAETRQQGGTKGEFKCIELATGKVMWSSKNTGHANALLCGNRLVLLNENGELITAEATPDRYHELSRASVMRGRMPCWTGPALCNNRLLVRNQESVACYYVGPAAQAPAPAAANLGRSEDLTYLFVQDWLTWAAKHQNRSFWNPNWSDFAAWYGWSLLILAAAAGLTALTRGKLHHSTVLMILTAVLGAIVMPLASFGLKKLVFTWPITGYAVLMLTAGTRFRTGVISRLVLLGFLVGCAAYGVICRRLLIDCGIGFLFGFAVALLFLRVWMRVVSGNRIMLSLMLAAVSFTAYYWVSAGFIHWVTN